MVFTDTGLNLPEVVATLREQQKQLFGSKRLAQMFPKRTIELELLVGFDRVETERGIFHYNPVVIASEAIKALSAIERENILLGLGPYNKADIAKRVLKGETPLVVTERTPDGVEIKAAVGTKQTAPFQIQILEMSKSAGSLVSVETVDQVLLWRRNNQWL